MGNTSNTLKMANPITRAASPPYRNPLVITSDKPLVEDHLHDVDTRHQPAAEHHRRHGPATAFAKAWPHSNAGGSLNPAPAPRPDTSLFFSSIIATRVTPANGSPIEQTERENRQDQPPQPR